MNKRKILGIFILALPFIGIFCLASYKYGLLVPIIAVLLTSLIISCIIIGVNLMLDYE